MTKRGRSGVENSAATSVAMRGRALVDLEGLLGDVVLGEHEREGAEGGGLDRVDADLEELARASRR